MKADVSVVIPCFNCSRTIRRALESVAAQSNGVREVIIVDDGSLDFHQTSGIVKSFENHFLIRIQRNETNRGVADARSQGVRLSASKYLAFLDADDIWFPDKIRIQYEFMETHRAVISGHGYVQDTASRMPGEISEELKFKRLTLWDYCYRHVYFTPTVMAVRESFINFDHSLKRCEDWSCWVENITGRGHNDAYFIDAMLAGGFKPAIGHSGLTGSVVTLHRDYLKALERLYSRGVVNGRFYALAVFVEYLKLAYRILRVCIGRSYRRCNGQKT